MRDKIRDILICAGFLALATVVGTIFYFSEFNESTIIMVYILSVLGTAIMTEHMVYSLVASAVSVLVFNFFFIDPRYSLRAYDRNYTVTFLIMFLVALISGTLTDQLKRNIKEREEATLHAKNEQLRADLLRSISHDLRTPLTSISGNASNLLHNGEEFDAQTRRQLYLDIYEDAVWLIHLVENLLSITRFEDGRVKLRFAPELMDEVIDEALRHIDRRKEEHLITVQKTEELLLARMDARLIVQVIHNIVDNALKYTQPGSHITIRVGREQDAIAVRIEDDGPGMADEVKQHVFDKFYSGARAVSDSRRGLGLGLALCKSIIEAHGGKIMVADNVPQGTVFTFTIPAGEVQFHE